jgi:integrase
MPLDKITEKAVNDWLLGFKNRKVTVNGKQEIKQYKNTYAHGIFGTLDVMLAEAVRRDLIPSNPCDKVQRLKNDRKKLVILTVEEVQKLFPKNYKSVWGNNELAYTANRLASITDMRIGEIQGLKGEFVFDTYIKVCGQFTGFGYKDYTKTKEDRNIPLMPEMTALLRKLTIKNGKGFVFSTDGGAAPVSQAVIRRAFNNALNKIGINSAEIKRRGITLHGWRHFLNTELQRQGLTIQQVQSVTGHKSDRMSEWYTHLDARSIADVVKAQASIAGTKEPETKSRIKKGKPKAEKEGVKIIKMPVRKSA